MHSVLITGGAGFIGQNLVHAWRVARPSDRLVVVDAMTYAANIRSLETMIARGEIAASVDRDVVLDLFFGAAEHRLLLGHLPMTGEFIADVVDMILDGVPRPES